MASECGSLSLRLTQSFRRASQGHVYVKYWPLRAQAQLGDLDGLATRNHVTRNRKVLQEINEAIEKLIDSGTSTLCTSLAVCTIFISFCVSTCRVVRQVDSKH